jgi:hypothetical protein
LYELIILLQFQKTLALRFNLHNLVQFVKKIKSVEIICRN